MAGVDTGGGGGGKRAVDQEINMIPFIDLLMVTISFLLITAVWSSMARLNASSDVKSHDSKQIEKKKLEKEPSVLHVYVSDKEKKFVLRWQAGTKMDDLASVDMEPDAQGRYPKLEEEIQKAYISGQASQNLWSDDLSYAESEASEHGGARLNQAILHVDNAFPFKEVVRVIDAVYSPRRYVCFAPKPQCCGKASSAGGKSPENCNSAADDVPAFNVTFSSN